MAFKKETIKVTHFTKHNSVYHLRRKYFTIIKFYYSANNLFAEVEMN